MQVMSYLQGLGKFGCYIHLRKLKRGEKLEIGESSVRQGFFSSNHRPAAPIHRAHKVLGKFVKLHRITYTRLQKTRKVMNEKKKKHISKERHGMVYFYPTEKHQLCTLKCSLSCSYFSRALRA